MFLSPTKQKKALNKPYWENSFSLFPPYDWEVANRIISSPAPGELAASSAEVNRISGQRDKLLARMRRFRPNTNTGGSGKDTDWIRENKCFKDAHRFPFSSSAFFIQRRYKLGGCGVQRNFFVGTIRYCKVLGFLGMGGSVCSVDHWGIRRQWDLKKSLVHCARCEKAHM